jgi:hypothetical protein
VWPRAFPVVQAPNAPLLVAFAGRGLQAVGRGRARRAGRAVFMLGLAVWAGEEAVDGVNWFRRLLGVATLGWMLRSAARGRSGPRAAASGSRGLD